MLKQISVQNIYKALDEKVVGQHEAKKVLAAALFLHIGRATYFLESGKPQKKSNVLLLGPSGNGKTELAKAAAEILQNIFNSQELPFISIDCNGLTPSGYIGDDVVDRIHDYQVIVKNKPTTIFEHAMPIVFLDEMDKLIASENKPSDYGAFRRAVQYNLLTLMEGGVFPVMDKQKRGDSPTVDTSNMLFICAGNFPAIRADRKARKKPSMGFTSDTSKAKEKTIQKELQETGLATQLVGRLSFIAELSQLTHEELLKILNKHLIPEYLDLFKYMHTKIAIPLKHRKSIVDQCMVNETGARGLRAELEKLVLPKIMNKTFQYYDYTKKGKKS